MWEYNHTPDSDELMHYGVLGMKWGVRRAKKNADRERKISRKVSKLEYKAEMARLKKKGLSDDKEKLYKAKAKKLANDEQIEQEYDQDMDAVAKKERGRKITMALIGAGVAAVTITAIAISKKKSSGDSVSEKGEEAVKNVLSDKKKAKASAKIAKASAKIAKYNAKVDKHNEKGKAYVQKMVDKYEKTGKTPFGRSASYVESVRKDWGI